MSQELRMSVILATDGWETIRPMVKALARQENREQLELVFVAERPQEIESHRSECAMFGAIEIQERPSITPLARARAQGVRAATAPQVFVAETHAFPEPDCLRELSEALQDPWSVVVPAFRNANPTSVWSWGGFLADYGSWSPGRAGGEISWGPVYNSLTRRSLLMGLGDRLDYALGQGDEMLVALGEGGFRSCFVPSAQIRHTNLSKGRAWASERLLSGRVIAANRRRRWSRARSLAYALGSPLIPFVLFFRSLEGAQRARRANGLPVTILAVAALGTVFRAIGEGIGYLVGSRPEHEAAGDRMEIHKLALAGHSEE